MNFSADSIHIRHVKSLNIMYNRSLLSALTGVFVFPGARFVAALSDEDCGTLGPPVDAGNEATSSISPAGSSSTAVSLGPAKMHTEEHTDLHEDWDFLSILYFVSMHADLLLISICRFPRCDCFQNLFLETLYHMDCTVNY